MVSRYIPEETKRKVRQKCGYCCIICGLMPTQYHHIVQFTEIDAHRVADIVLLCNRCHEEVTQDRLCNDEIRKHQRRPYALVHGRPRYDFLHKPVNRIFAIGHGITLQNGQVFDILRTDTHKVFSVRVEGGIPLFTLEIRDRNGTTSFEMVDNVISFDVSGVYDVRLQGPKFEVWKEKGRKIVELAFHKSEILLKNLEVYADGFAIAANEYGIAFKCYESPGHSTIGMNMIENDSNPILITTEKNTSSGYAFFRIMDDGNVSFETAEKWFKTKPLKEHTKQTIEFLEKMKWFPK